MAASSFGDRPARRLVVAVSEPAGGRREEGEAEKEEEENRAETPILHRGLRWQGLWRVGWVHRRLLRWFLPWHENVHQ
jgi:hypothetical protein